MYSEPDTVFVHLRINNDENPLRIKSTEGFVDEREIKKKSSFVNLRLVND